MERTSLYSEANIKFSKFSKRVKIVEIKSLDSTKILAYSNLFKDRALVRKEVKRQI